MDILKPNLQKIHDTIKNKELLERFLQFLVWCGSKENHGRMFPTLAVNDWYGLKYGTDDLQIFPITDFNKFSTGDIIKRFEEWDNLDSIGVIE